MMVFKPPKTDDAKKLLAYAAEIERLEQENASLRGQSPPAQPFRERLMQYRDHVPTGIQFAALFLNRSHDVQAPRAVPTNEYGEAVVMSLRLSDSNKITEDAASDALTAYFRNLERIERVLLATHEELTAPEASAGPPKAGPFYNGGMV